ncbi:invasion associated locus B family protein [Limibacillus sp. MBR-115]|jgi:invasion protein IalB|uniref:invasion associated locus B family protein n=1 Tax=Limibacillus sp. MBR-115 TaxID=3156465 RepID=UPI003397C9A4
MMHKITPSRPNGVTRFLTACLVLTAILSLPRTAAAQGADADGAIFKDWRIRCSPAQNAEGQDQPVICEAYQVVLREDQQQPVLEVVIAFPPSQENAVGAIIVPLGVLLPAGIAVSIDEKPLGKLPYQRCGAKGCLGQFIFTPEQFKAWRSGTKGQVTITHGNGKELAIPLSLLGFTDATNAISKK